MKDGDSLDQVRSDILFLLWKRQWEGDGNLVTPADLIYTRLCLRTDSRLSSSAASSGAWIG